MDNNDKEFGIDRQILQDGAIAMYYDMEILDKDLDWFVKNNYRIFDFDTTEWTIEKSHEAIKAKMNFPDYYGKNLNAFNDCLGDMYDTDFKGQVIVFRHFDKFSFSDKDFCHGLLDIIAIQSRKWLLGGQRLIGIIQSDDPNIFYDKVGGNPPYWNRQEWFTASRKKKQDG